MGARLLQYDDNAGSGYISGNDGSICPSGRSDLQRLQADTTAGMKFDYVAEPGRRNGYLAMRCRL